MTQRHVLITLCFLIASGTVNIIGSNLIRYVYQVVMALGHPSPEPLLIVIDFLSGMIGFGLLIPLIVPKAISIIERSVGWPTWGSSWGAVVGLLNSLVFAAIHLSMVSFGPEGWEKVKFAPDYLFTNAITMGVPSALIGAVVGGASEIFWHRFSSERKNGTGYFSGG
jgi:hypothetical protein